MKWIGGFLAFVLFGLFLLLVLVFTGLFWFNIPQNAAGMAAKSVCSAYFVAGRAESAETLMAQDVLPASPALSLIATSINTDERTVTSRFLGVISRRASLLDKRGCVLDAEPQPSTTPYIPGPLRPEPWPAGDAATAVSDLPDGVDATKLKSAVDAAFVGAGDPKAANARGVAVVQNGRLLAVKEADPLVPSTALHGWSMTKTVAAMLFYKKAVEVGLDSDTRVVDAFPAGREPSWVADWRNDERKDITIADLLYMRDGLRNDEGYDVTGSVVQMLYGEPDMSAWAAEHPAAHPAGTYWQYLSATANILAAVTRGQFATDEEYWDYSKTALFDPIGVTSGTLETDTSGTWVGSSYQWASVRDWARLGQLMLDDGRWGDSEVLPAGWLKVASTPAMPEGEGHGYGAQSWLLGDPVAGECKAYPGVPADTIAMEGHWGQLVAMIPSRKTVLVRLGWTFNSDQFDGCQLISDVLSALPQK
jgi:CubicO group peptidase (beta-lactamase class C family)